MAYSRYVPVGGAGGGGGGSGTVTQVNTGSGLTGGPITTTGTVALADTTVTPGTYGDATHVSQVTVDQQGRITGASSVAITAGGSGTVTSVSVTTANGVSGSVATPTTTPAISLTLGAITPTSVAASSTVTGSNLSGTNTGDQTNITGNAGTVTTINGHIAAGTNVTVTGTGTTGSPYTINSTAAGGVTSFTGDGTVLNNSASTGAVTAALSSAGPYSVLGNATGSSAAPTYGFGMQGTTQIAVSTTLIASSAPTILATAAVTITLPLASTCIGKSILVMNAAGASASVTVNCQGGDALFFSAAGSVSTWVLAPILSLLVQSTASGAWRVMSVPGWQTTNTGASLVAGGVMYGTTSQFATSALSAAGTSGQILQSTGTTAPTWTSTPGSGTALTSISATKAITTGISPTIAGGGTIGSGGTVAFNGTAHDESGSFTVTAGTGATAAVVTLTFGAAAYANAPNVVVMPASAAAAAIAGATYISSQGTGSFALTLGTLIGASVYTFSYLVRQ